MPAIYDLPEQSGDLPSPRIVWTMPDGREISSCGSPGMTAEALASSVIAAGIVPEDTPWREVDEDYVISPTLEEQYNAERAVVEAKYSAPWNGTTGGVLSMLQMTIISAMARGADTTAFNTQYQNELTAMSAEFQAIDEKYGVA